MIFHEKNHPLWVSPMELDTSTQSWLLYTVPLMCAMVKWDGIHGLGNIIHGIQSTALGISWEYHVLYIYIYLCMYVCMYISYVYIHRINYMIHGLCSSHRHECDSLQWICLSRWTWNGDPQSGYIIKHHQAFKLLTMAHRYASIIDPHWHSARQPGAQTWSIWLGITTDLCRHLKTSGECPWTDMQMTN